MKIKEVTSEHILFDNDSKITYHSRKENSYSVENYADFEQLDTIARNTEFDSNLIFEKADNYGFRFGNKPNKMFFVPCYSHQNGYYSSEISIDYNDETVLKADGYIY